MENRKPSTILENASESAEIVASVGDILMQILLKIVQIQVYSSETGSWSLGCKVARVEWNVDFEKEVYCNGSIHWLHNNLSPQIGTVLYRIHVDTGVFHKMLSPPVVRDQTFRSNDYFGESCDHLHFIEPVLPRFSVNEMKRDYSEWFVKYKVDLSPFMDVYPEVIMAGLALQNLYAIHVLSLIGGEDYEDSKLVLRIPGKAIKFNIVDGTSEKLCNFTHDSNES